MPRAAMSVATSARVSPRAEGGERPLALALALVAMNGGSVDARFVERPGDAVGAALGAGEDDDARELGIVEQFDQKIALLRRFDEEDVVLDAIGGLGRRRHRDLDRIVQQFAGERADVGGHGRREEQVLALFGQFPHDAADRLDEAEVEHLIDLVEHQKFDRAETRDAGVEMIEQASGRRNEHVEARLKRADLRAMRHAAEHDGDLEAKAVRKIAEALGDLAREFPRRAQHKDASPASRRRAPVSHKPMKDRQREGGRLAGAGLGDADEIAALHQGRDRLGLNRGRTRIAKLGQRDIEGRGKAEPVKTIQDVKSFKKCRSGLRRA